MGQSFGEVLILLKRMVVFLSSLATCTDFNPVFVFVLFFGPDINLLSDTPEFPGFSSHWESEIVQPGHESLRSSLLHLTRLTDLATDFAQLYDISACLYDNFHLAYFHAHTTVTIVTIFFLSYFKDMRYTIKLFQFF